MYKFLARLFMKRYGESLRAVKVSGKTYIISIQEFVPGNVMVQDMKKRLQAVT